MENLTTRRELLKMMASLPFTLSLGLGSNFVASASPATRTKETGFSLEIAESAQSGSAFAPVLAKLHESSFAGPGASWVAFETAGKGDENRGFAVRQPSGEYAAFSAKCPHLGCRFELITEPEAGSQSQTAALKGPALACSCHGSLFDLGDNGRLLSGPARPPLLRYRTKQCHDKICILAAEPPESA